MDNIFSTLWKYRPQGEINPEENYFTESFKFILNADDSFCAKFVKFASKKRLEAPFNIESQVVYGNSIIDLQITDKRDKKLLIEIKVGARQNMEIDDDGNESGQIEKYLKLGKGYVCFIERDRDGLNEKILKNINFTGHYAWSEVYELLSDHIKAGNKTNPTIDYFEENFLKFMQQKDMMPFEKFTKEDAQIAPMVPDFYNRMEKFLDYARKSKPLVDFCDKNKLEIGQPYFDSARNLAVYFSNKGQKLSGDCYFFMGFTYVDNTEINEVGVNTAGIYFVIDVICNRVKIADNIISKIKINPAFKRQYMSGTINREIAYKTIFFPEFVNLGREGMIKYILKSFNDIEKTDIIKAIRPYL